MNSRITITFSLSLRGMRRIVIHTAIELATGKWGGGDIGEINQHKVCFSKVSILGM